MARPMTKALHNALMLDLPVPSIATKVDFGIKTVAHHTALMGAVRRGVTVNELDLALGDGPTLTALCGGDVVFTTAYDDFPPEEEEDC